MKENKSNELKKDSLEQVAGGGPGYDMADVTKMQDGLMKLVAAAANAEPPGSPERTKILEAAAKLSSKILDITRNMAQALYNQGERLNAIEDSLGRN